MTKHQSFMFWPAGIGPFISGIKKKIKAIGGTPLWLTRTVMNGFVRNGVFQFVNIGKF